MAVTSVWAIKGRVDNMIRYIANPEKTTDWETAEALHKIENAIQYSADELKTEELTYVSYINCTAGHAAEQFMATKQNWGKPGGRACYHGIQSFKPGETTADEAHAIGIALAQELWGDRFEVVVATHCNTDCYHNHFVFNSVSFVDGYKFYCMLEDEQRMRDVSDRLCRENRLSVIEHPKGEKMHYAEYMARKNGKYVIRDGVREDIDRAIRSAATRQDFVNILRDMGYTLHIYKKNGQLRDRPSLRPPDASKPVRFDGLGPEYTLEAIERRIRSNGIRRNPFPESEKQPHRYLGTFRIKGSYSNAPKATGLRALYFHYCYKLKILRKYPASIKRVSIYMREDLKNMDSMIAQMELLGREHIETTDQLVQYKSDTELKISMLEELRQELYNAKRRADRQEDAAGSAALKSQISDITSQLKMLRKEVVLCSKIEERSAQVKENLEQIKQQETERKEPTHNEHWRRRSRSDRQDDPERR